MLGIGTQTNNTLSGVTTFPANASGNFTTVFNGTANNSSFIDSGSNGLFFSDSALTACLDNTGKPTGWYCQSPTVSLSAINEGGVNGTPSGTVSFQIGSATALFNSGNSVFVELGGTMPPAASGFDWGLPFFFGRNVFVGIEGKSSNLGAGLYWAY